MTKEPKPCPKCGSESVEVDAGPMTTSMKGIDYQDVWVECLDCGFEHCINACDYPYEDELTDLCIEQWNSIPADNGK